MSIEFPIAGAFVGLLVGLTGVGGGSLMAPILIILFGAPPAVAVGTDLWFAFITKSVGGMLHHRSRSVEWKIAGWLALGSLPAATGTLIWLKAVHSGRLQTEAILHLLGAALTLVATLMVFKPKLQQRLQTWRQALGARMRAHQTWMTCAGGAVVGILVTLTSVGAGALVAVLLMLLYPLRLNSQRIVATDIVHAVPLTLVAAIGQSWLGNVDAALLGQLLIGSVPGIVVGALLAHRVSDSLLRYALAAMLLVSATKLLAI